MLLDEQLSLGEMRANLLEIMERSLHSFQLRGAKPESGELTKREPAPLLKLSSSEEIAAELRLLAVKLQREFPLQAFRFDSFGRLVQDILDFRTPSDALEVWNEVQEFEGILRQPRSSAPPDASSNASGANPIAGEAPIADSFDINVEGTPAAIHVRQADATGSISPGLQEALERLRRESDFLAGVMSELDRARQAGRGLRGNDRLAIEHAYAMLDRGAKLPPAFQGLGTSGFRRWQTSLSLADPGDGHLKVTVQDAKLLAGTIVHVEHIDRDKVADREKIEPYRLPATRHAARVRLHVGEAAPVSAFIGRPVFENQNVPLDLLKSVHLTASACSAMFAQGIADCKIGIEHLTARESILFMRAVAGNVIRDSARQTLSAAYNINTAIVDDRFEGAVEKVEAPLAIAALGIELTVTGGFDKIAWDGASNKIPSDPVIGQLSFAELIGLVHQAHERGLETYISAGLKAEHMRDSAFLGVGGVGIGTSMHFSDPVTKLMGELKPAAIRQALETRNQAMAEPRGKAALWLAWLDRMYFEGLLNNDLDVLRAKLFSLAVQGDAAVALPELLEKIRERAVALHRSELPAWLAPEGGFEPTSHLAIVQRANRLMSAYQRQQVSPVRAMASASPGLDGRLVQVKQLLDENDFAGLADLFQK